MSEKRIEMVAFVVLIDPNGKAIKDPRSKPLTTIEDGSPEEMAQRIAEKLGLKHQPTIMLDNRGQLIIIDRALVLIPNPPKASHSTNSGENHRLGPLLNKGLFY